MHDTLTPKANKTPLRKIMEKRMPAGDAHAASAGLEELMRKAIHAAGCKDVAAFKKLPTEEQNAFLAQARGDAKNPARGMGELVQLDPATVRRSPFNRDDFDKEELAELIADVKARGVVQPGMVRPVNPPVGKIAWEIIAGERRWLAATAAKVLYPAVVRDVDDTEAIELQAIENFQREDLNPMDEAKKYEQLRECYMRDGLTATAAVERIAEKLHRKTSTIYGLLALAAKLVSNVQVLIRSGALPKSHGELLTKIRDPKRQMELAGQMLKAAEWERGDHGKVMSFRDAKRLVEQAEDHEEAARKFAAKAAEIERVEGSQVFTGKAAEKLRNGSDYVEFTNRAPEFCGSWKDEHTWEKLTKGQTLPPPVLVEDYHGEPIVMYPKAAMTALAKANGHKPASGREQSGGGTDAQAQANHRVRMKAFEALLGPVAEAGERLDGPEFLRFLFVAVVGQFRESVKRAVKRRGIAVSKAGYVGDALSKAMATANGRELRGALAELVFARFAPSTYSSGWDKEMAAACKLFGVQMPPWSAAKIKAEAGTQASGNSRPAKAAAPVGRSTPATRARLAAKMKERWAQRKAAAKA